MSAGPPSAQPRTGHPRGPRRRPGAADRPAPAGRHGTRLVPLAILLFMAGIAVRLALDALGSGRIEAAIGALLVVGIVLALLVRQLFRNRG